MSKLSQTRTPSMAEVLKAALDQKLFDTHTMLPGRVEKYSENPPKADVKPLIKNDLINEDGEELDPEVIPVIPDVPVVFPQGGGFFMSLPLKKGDFVYLVFCERSIDRYVQGAGDDTDPIDLRTHDLSDAIAVPGFFPFSQAVQNASNDNMVLGQDNDGSQIHIKSGGIIEITFDGGNTLSITNKGSDATLTLGDGTVSALIAEAFETFWNSFANTTFNGHTHTYVPALHPAPVPVPTGTPTPTASTLPSNNISTKVKFPNG